LPAILFQQTLEFVDVLDLFAVGLVAQLFQNLARGGGAEIGANQRGFEIVEGGAVDLLADGDDIFDALGQVLAGARDGLFMRSIKLGFFSSSRLPNRSES